MLLMVAVSLLWVAGCASNDYSGSEYDRFRSSQAGRVILASLVKQGYQDWAGEKGVEFKLRSQLNEGKSRLLTIEDVACDIRNSGFSCRGNEGADIVKRTYIDGEYTEMVGDQSRRDPEKLVNGRRRLLNDYLFLALPFLVADKARSMDNRDREIIDGINYNVVEVRFQPSGHFPPEETYLLYYSHSTERLEKIFFTASGGERKGSGIWCELDNFAMVDDILLPVHRKFFVVPEGGEKEAEPFLEQWIYETSFGSVDL
jgi:hypothetical protein